MSMAETPFHDLHTHTHCSDGELTPTELVTLAARQGVTIMALSDHDTFEGLAEARRAGERFGVEVIAAIELSATLAQREFHVLAYFVRRPEIVQPVLDDIAASRRTRARQIVDRLEQLGYRLDWPAVQKRAQGTVIGRPHIAAELVAQGHVATMSGAFNKLLGDGKPACIPKRTVSVDEGLRLLQQAGGVPVLAHPATYDCDEELLDELVSLGLQGLEVWHPQNDAVTSERYLQWVESRGLLATGGSDFHRMIEGGILPGDVGVTPERLAALRSRAG
jgi:predicted metal-dependent phosphoesterase TrpH